MPASRADGVRQGSWMWDDGYLALVPNEADASYARVAAVLNGCFLASRAVSVVAKALFFGNATYSPGLQRYSAGSFFIYRLNVVLKLLMELNPTFSEISPIG